MLAAPAPITMIVSIDTETHLITEAEPVPRVVLVQTCDDDGVKLEPAHRVYPGRLAGIFDEAAHIAMHNAPFDVNAMGRRWPDLWPHMIGAYKRGAVHDTMTCEKMIDIAEGTRHKGTLYNLGAVGLRRAGVEVDKTDPYRLMYGSFDGLELEQYPAGAVTYAAKDAIVTYHVARLQLDHAHYLTDAPRQARAHIALYEQTLRGILTDQEMVERLDRLLEQRWLKLAAQLIDHGLARLGGTKAEPKVVRNTKVAKGMVAEWATEQGLPIVRSEKTQQPSLAADTLEALNLPSTHPLFAYQALGSVGSQRTKNIPPLRYPVVRCRYDECIGTGRTSSAAPSPPWHGTSLQNVMRTVHELLGYATADEMDAEIGPIGFRECLVPPTGHSLVAADWSMMELVCLAQVQLDWFGRSALAAALIAGRDPHEELGSTIAGFDIRNHSERKIWRTLAKAPNFGFIGGLGAKRLCDFARGTYGIQLTERRARELRELWRRQWPEMALYHQRIDSMPRDEDGKIIIRLDRTGFQRRGTYTEACNFPFQALAAACAKDALWAIWLACRTPGNPLYGCWQVLFVHDENVLVVPDDRLETAVPHLEEIMIAAVARLCPDVPVGVETAVTKRYGK